MTRKSKPARRRAQSPRKPRQPGLKTGPKKCATQRGFKEHVNALEGDNARLRFIPKI